LHSTDNKNVEALTAAQAALQELEYGFAPLLVQDETRLVIEKGPDGERIRLAYPRQPADPTDWVSVDSFVLGYAARSKLLASPQVRRVVLGRFDLAAPVDQLEDQIKHYAVWLRFVDGSEAVVDLTPLATDFAPRHVATTYTSDPATIEEEFTAHREGVSLDILQPMDVVREEDHRYYLVAKVSISPDRYLFSLRVHLTQTATPIRPLQLTRGAGANLEIDRTDFEAVRQLIVAAGPDVFLQQPELLSRSGNNDPSLVRVLDQNLFLLWHMVTKLVHEPVPANLPTSTPTPVPTPTPSPTPTPTLTPVLLTS
jgi:hypothetical protein